MHRWIALWLLYCLLGLCTTLSGQTRIYKFDEIPEDQGFSNITTTTCFQDSYGYIWFGGYSGLAKYDGYETKWYNNDPQDQLSLIDNKVNDIAEDSLGNLWIITQNGISYYQRKNDQFIQFTRNDIGRGDYYQSFYYVFIANDGTVLFINRPEIYKYDPLLNKFTKLPFIHDPENKSFNKSEKMFEINGKIYLISKDSINLIDLKNDKLLHDAIFSIFDKYNILFPVQRYYSEKTKLAFFTPSGFVISDTSENSWDFYPKEFDINEDIGYGVSLRNKYWIGFKEFLVEFDNDTKIFSLYQHQEELRNSLKGGFISDLMIDKNEDLWIPTVNGVSILKQNALSRIKSYNCEYTKKVKNAYGVRSSIPIGQNFFLLAEDSKLILFNPVSGHINSFLPELQNEISHKLSHIVCFLKDSKNRVWMGGQEGLLVYDRNIQKLDSYLFDKKDPTKAFLSVVKDIYEDSDENIWISSWRNGIGLWNETNQDFTNVLPGFAMRKTFEDSQGNLWFGSREGVFKRPMGQDTFIQYTHDNKNSNSIGENTGFCFYEDDQGLIYVGTYGGGLNIYDPFTDVFRMVGEKDGLANNNIFAIFPDHHGNIWLCTFRGWSRYNLKTGAIRNYNSKDGFYNPEFDAFGSCQDPETGFILSEGTIGFDYFNPDDFQDDTIVPKLVFTDLQIFNRSVSIARNDRQLQNRDTFYLPQSLDFTTSITLPYHFNVITLTYAGLHFTNPTGIQYAHYLDGFQQDWQYVGTQRSATYTNLNPGQYTFHVKAANPDGVWNEEGRSLQITILPPWWRTWWAYTLYGIAILLLLTGIYLFQRRRWLLKAQLAAEKQEADRLKELDGIKTALYTNITHEFRTPLTVILGLTNIIREQFPQLDQQQIFEHLKTIDRNGNSLLQLVNQMLDLAKLEAGKLDLDPVQDDIGAFTKYLIESFHSLAEQKNIRLQCHIPATPLVVDFDPLRYQQIVQNLVSNAIKFTPDDGTISVQIYESNQHMLLSVADDGIGIAPESLPHLFDRFFQVESSATRRGEGTGIGLALTKELVQVMQGTITVESTPGEGTLFTVLLPITRLAQKRSVWTALPSFGPLNAEIESASGPQGKEVKRLPDLSHILIIEDNTDVRAYLRSCLPEQYYVQEAINGKAGVEKAIEQVPDLIISDVMMPEMDGFEVCTTLKNDERTSHIPVILLTAKADDASRMSGYRHGADAYLIKPFNREELLVRMEQMLALRKRLQARYSRIDSRMTDDDVQFQQEDAFITRVRETVLEHLEDPNFAIPQLCQSLLISRTQLHNKLVALTGKSTSHVIRTIRLQRGKELLQQTDQQVAEIAYSVGFSDPNYFSRCYHEEYGVTPSEERTS